MLPLSSIPPEDFIGSYPSQFPTGPPRQFLPHHVSNSTSEDPTSFRTVPCSPEQRGLPHHPLNILQLHLWNYKSSVLLDYMTATSEIAIADQPLRDERHRTCHKLYMSQIGSGGFSSLPPIVLYTDHNHRNFEWCGNWSL